MDEHGNPIPIQDMGENDRAVLAGWDEHGNPLVQVKPADEQVRTRTCPAPCAVTLDVGGQSASYDPTTGFQVSQPAQPGRPGTDVATSSDEAGLVRDADGNGEGWVKNTGEITDGATGETISYPRTAPSDRPVNTVRLSDAHGSPFTASCDGGCDYTVRRCRAGRGGTS